MTAIFTTLLILISASQVNVRLVPAVADAQVELILYRIEGEVFWEIPAGDCRTDEKGECQIRLAREIRDRAGFLRGYLQANGIKRPVLWPGGQVWVEVPLALARDEAYDYLESPPTPAIEYRREKRISWLSLGLAGLAAYATWQAYRAAKRQENKK